MKYLINFEKYTTDDVLDNLKKEIENDPQNTLDKYELELGREGKLSKYLRDNNRIFTFGILKCLFHDAIEYKKKREMIKGGYKMFHRLVPMTLSLFYFPVALVGYILGTSRAFDKVIVPILQNPEKKYNDFLVKIINGAISISEGEIKMFMGKDWFYDAFVMDDDLVKMIKPEILRSFAVELANQMENEPDEDEVPHNYIENKLKTYLNENYNITPPMPLDYDE